MNIKKRNSPIYQKEDITITLIEEQDISTVLKLFEENTFCVTPNNAVRPTTCAFYDIIKQNMNNEKRDDAVVVIRKNGRCIGYISAFVSFNLLTIGHIAVDTKEQHKGYGELLTKIMQQIAIKEERNISFVCHHPNKYLTKLGFQTNNGVNYFFNSQNKALDMELPTIFISTEEYKQREEEKNQKELESYRRFLKSPLGEFINNL